MDKQKLNDLFNKTHFFAGLLHETSTKETIGPNMINVLRKSALALQEAMAETGLLMDPDCLHGPNTSFNIREEAEAGDDALDNRVAPVVPKPWMADTAEEEMPEHLTSEVPDDKLYDKLYNDDEEPEMLEVIDEEEEENMDMSPEGKYPDMSYFTIVEKVNYRSSLFDNSKKALDDTMILLSSLTGYSKAVEYLQEKLHWHPESNEQQATFLTKLHECFCKGKKVEE